MLLQEPAVQVLCKCKITESQKRTMPQCLQIRMGTLVTQQLRYQPASLVEYVHRRITCTTNKKIRKSEVIVKGAKRHI